MKRKNLQSICPTVCRLLGVRNPQKAEEHYIPEIIGDLFPATRVCLVVLDAYGVSTWQKHRDSSPFFNRLAEKRIIQLESARPAITPVNFAAMATGSPAEIHGVFSRKDKIKVETIFDVMKKCAVKSTISCQKESSLCRLFDRAYVYSAVSEAGMDSEVLTVSIETIRYEKPDFLWVQFLEIDRASHTFGPGSGETGDAIQETDRRLKILSSYLLSANYSTIILADHGQHEVTDNEKGLKGWHDGSVEEDLIVPMTWVSRNSAAMI